MSVPLRGAQHLITYKSLVIVRQGLIDHIPDQRNWSDRRHSSEILDYR